MKSGPPSFKNNSYEAFYLAKDAIVIPLLCNSEQSIAGAILIKLASLLKMKVFTVDATVTARQFDSLQRSEEHVVYGFILGLTDSVHVNLSSKKEGIERGRALAAAMKVKFWAEDQKVEPFLKKNHYYFGNFPGVEGKEKTPRTFYEKVFRSFLAEDPIEQTVILRIIHSLVRRLGVDSYSSTEFDKLVEANTVSFQEFEQKLFRTKVVETSSKKQKKSTVMVAGPKKPKTSTLLTKGEMEIIHAIFNELWEGLDDYNRNWKSYIQTYTYSQLESMVRQILNSRYSLLDKYRRMTTTRLIELRKALNLPKIRKSQVTAEQRTTMISARPDPVTSYYRELVNVFGEQTIKVIFPDTSKLMPLLVTAYPWKQYTTPEESFSVSAVKKLSMAFNKVSSLDRMIYQATGYAQSMGRYTILLRVSRESSKRTKAAETALLACA